MISEALSRFGRLELVPLVTPLQCLERLSHQVGRDLHVKRGDLTPFGLSGNKARQLQYPDSDAWAQQADTLVTAGLLDALQNGGFEDDKPVVFPHTGGTPALFGYQPLTPLANRISK